MRIHLAEGLEDRHILWLAPDKTGKVAMFDDEGTPAGLPLVGWACMFRLPDGEAPVISVGPVVEESSFGPIAVEDLLHEVPGLVYRGFES